MRLRVERVAHLHLPRLLAERGHEVVVERPLGEDALRLAALARGVVIDQTALGIAESRSASAKTTFGLLPPSSSVSRLIGSEQSRMISPPVFVEPVKATLSTPGWRTR